MSLFTRHPRCGGCALPQGAQDGGSNNFGTVIELREWKGEPDRIKFGVRVVWDRGGANTYRWGAEDAFDLQIAGESDSSVDVEALRLSVPPATPLPSPPLVPEQLTALKAIYEATGGHESWRSRQGW